MPSPKFIDGSEAHITCPNDGAKLIVRTTRKNGHQFLGCPRFPECNHTQQIPESWKMRVLGQKEFDMLIGEDWGLSPDPKDDENYGLGI